eukprot:TRINITY_DN30821_c0_g1_i1.p2 TRINITY_DN30821_c0_g1~~TRINITY_DN30821_c0_g1_i1.p2  ORF type:complete len:193 (-),score=29.12 TRINITY_DN30821_c0_g1_i1:34-612(-)
MCLKCCIHSIRTVKIEQLICNLKCSKNKKCLKQKHVMRVQELQKKKIFNLMKQIFEQFDSDGDGQISSKNIDISQIPNQILELLTPLLYELDEISESLNFEEFLQAVERLLKTFTINQKHQLLKYAQEKKKAYVDSQCTFKPKINKKSREIAQKAFDKQVKLLQQQDISEISEEKEILSVTPALFPTKIKEY